MIITDLNPKTHTLAQVMSWAFDNLDKNTGYHVGGTIDGSLVFRTGGTIYIRDLPPTLQASDSAFPLSDRDLLEQ